MKQYLQFLILGLACEKAGSAIADVLFGDEKSF
jgi:hypothetical protein